jgi:hypothetical protein
MAKPVRRHLKPPKNILPRNVGVFWERTLYEFGDGRENPEKVFMEAWDKENRPRPGVNDGLPIAQGLMNVPSEAALNFEGEQRDDTRRPDLFTSNYGGWGERVCVYKLTPRENQILATVIQWLGTNCGFGFLSECLERSGYHIVSSNRSPPEPEKKCAGRYDILKDFKKRQEKEKKRWEEEGKRRECPPETNRDIHA